MEVDTILFDIFNTNEHVTILATWDYCNIRRGPTPIYYYYFLLLLTCGTRQQVGCTRGSNTGGRVHMWQLG